MTSSDQPFGADAGMTDADEAALSAWIDGELATSAVPGLIDALCRGRPDDEHLRQRWQRYHLIGEVLRSQPSAGAAGFAADMAFIDRLRPQLTAQTPPADARAAAAREAAAPAAPAVTPMPARRSTGLGWPGPQAPRPAGAGQGPLRPRRALAAWVGVALVSAALGAFWMAALAPSTMTSQALPQTVAPGGDGASSVGVEPRLEALLSAHQSAAGGHVLAAPGRLRRVEVRQPVAAPAER